MASGPYFDPRRGSWAIQYWNGVKWCRVVVVKKPPGWKPGMPMPKKPPPAALAALGEYAKREQIARERKSPASEQTVEGFLAAYRETFAASRKAGSTGELDKAIRTFLAWCAESKIARVADVTSSSCHRWISARLATTSPRTGRPIQRSTVEKERAYLASAWSQAARREEVEKNPWEFAPMPGKGPKKERKSWSPAQFDRLLAACKPWLRDVLILGVNTGLRISALRKLEWRDVEWANTDDEGYGWVVVRPENDKAKVGYRVPMNEACHDLLARRHLHSKDAHPTVLLGHKGGPISDTSITTKAICRACDNAKLDRPASPNHHCRRTFGRWAVLGHLTGEPVPLYVVSKWLGHASVKMTEHYLDLKHDDSTMYMIGRKKGGDAKGQR